MVTQATAFETGRVGVTDTRLDWINHAIAQAEEDELPTTGIVLSKADWRKMTATKDAGGNYISDDSPFGLTAPRLWNLPVLATNAMPAGQFAVGPWREAVTIYDRLEVEVPISTENSMDFENNLATVRIEERVALVNQRPTAFITGTFA